MFKFYFKTLILFLIFNNNLYALKKSTVDNYVFELLPNKPKVVKSFLKRNIKDPYCCYLLGTIYLMEKDLKNADKYLTQAAKNGSLDAINSIGDGYYSGDIRKKNHKEALKCYGKAAKQGHGAAQFNAGSVYFKYSKSISTLKKAIYWLDKASKNDDIKELRKYILKCKKIAQKKLNELIENEKNKNNTQYIK